MKRKTRQNNRLSDKPAQSIPVFRAADFSVTDGANLGDALSFANELMLDDIYGLSMGAEVQRLSLLADYKPHFTIADGTQLGSIGAALHLDSCITLMSPDGRTTEILILVEVDDHDMVAEIYALPLAPLHPKTDYSLVGINRDSARRKFAQVACVSFSRGTHIATVSGQQVQIEDLRVGDMVLTRDDGPQKIRWIGQTTVRAVGEFAPIKIAAGTLNNVKDLVVSPDHRLFIYQRNDRIGAGRSEVLVKARHLVDGDSVTQQDGGFVDYFQILFDRHQIIYAEGIAAETLLIDTRTSPVLPPELTDKLSQPLMSHANRRHMNFEVHERLLDRPDAVEQLRRASTK